MCGGGVLRAAILPELSTDTSLAPVSALPSARALQSFLSFLVQALGVDDGRLLIPVLLIPVLVFVTYQGFAAEQDNEDFFDTYDQRRK